MSAMCIGAHEICSRAILAKLIIGLIRNRLSAVLLSFPTVGKFRLLNQLSDYLEGAHGKSKDYPCVTDCYSAY